MPKTTPKPAKKPRKPSFRRLQRDIQKLPPTELAALRAWLRDLESTATQQPSGSRPLSVEQLADLAMTRPNHSDAVEGLYQAWHAGGGVFEQVLQALRTRGMTDDAIRNLKYRATSVLPFMREHGLRSSVFTVTEVIGAMRTRGRYGHRLYTDCANALFELLRQPNVSQEDAEALRRRFEPQSQ
jgi:hypothetical protein